MQYFYIFTNSPGEVFSWVKPLVKRLIEIENNPKVLVFLTPCQYATGQEQHVCLSFPGVSNVYLPLDTIKSLFMGTFTKGTVFYMGGDPFYPKRFAKRTGSKLIGYSENKLSDKQFDLVLHKTKHVDLMVSNLLPVSKDKRSGIVLLPGSRPEHLDVALPLMLGIVDGTDVDVMLSPFTKKMILSKYQRLYPSVHFKIQKDANDLSHYKYALTIPGTNTMQLAYLKVPYFMIFPTHDSKILRLDGLIGLLLHIPLLGTLLKRIILTIAIKKKRFYSIPNIYFNKNVFPELVGKFTMNHAKAEWKQFLVHMDQSSLYETAYSELDLITDPLDSIADFLKKN